MANFRSSYGARRLALGVFLSVLLGFFLLPHQLQTLFQEIGGPVGWVLSWPMRDVNGQLRKRLGCCRDK
jgi:rod shape-determining protein MreC